MLNYTRFMMQGYIAGVCSKKPYGCLLSIISLKHLELRTLS